MATVEAGGGGSVGDLATTPVGSALRSGTVYAGAAAFQRGLIFLLLPVYTRVLDPSQYGRLSVLLGIAAVAIILLSFGMDTAFFRTYFALRHEPDRQSQFVTTAWVFLLVVPPAVALVLGLVAAPLLDHSDVVPPVPLALALGGAALFVSATIVPLALLRAEERLRDYLVVTAVTAGASTGFTLLAVVGFNAGVNGWLVAVMAANALTLVTAVRVVPLRLSPGLDRRLLIGAMALGLPLVPHLLSHWGLGISNRLVLASIVSTADVGIYSLASNLAVPVAIVLTGLATGFMPTYARAANEPAALAALPRMIMVQFLLVLGITTAGMLLGPIAVHYLAPPEYSAASGLVPWIMAGYGLLGLYFLPMNAVALTAGRTRRIWLVTVGAATVNLACVEILVPTAGLTGAAVAVTVGYMVLLVGVGLYSRGPDNPVRYEWARMGRAGLTFSAVYALALLTSGHDDLFDAGVRLLWLMAALPLLVLARVADRAHVVSAIRRLSTRRRLAASA